MATANTSSTSQATEGCWTSPSRAPRQHTGLTDIPTFNSPFPWFASPMKAAEGEALSPESALSFSLSSPPRTINKAEVIMSSEVDILNSCFSPSIFSPPQKYRPNNTSHHGTKHDVDGIMNLMGSPDDYLGGLSQDSRSPLKGGIASMKRSKQHKSDYLRLKFKKHTTPEDEKDEYDEEYNEEEYDEENFDEEYEEDDDYDDPDYGEQPSRHRRRHKGKSPNDMKIKLPLKRSVLGLKTPEGSSLLPPMVSPNDEFNRRLSQSSMSPSSSYKGNDKSSIRRNIQSIDDIIDAEELKRRNIDYPEIICNCKKSRCLKLYCDCFAILKFCDVTCHCYECLNTQKDEEIRNDAIRSVKERNHMAFQVKVKAEESHISGCHCKNSHCLKKYCECFTAHALCGVNCKCKSCQNFEGSLTLEDARSQRSPPGLNSGSGNKKRKESPNSIAFEVSPYESGSAKKAATEPARPMHYGLRPPKEQRTAEKESSSFPSSHEKIVHKIEDKSTPKVSSSKHIENTPKSTVIRDLNVNMKTPSNTNSGLKKNMKTNIIPILSSQNSNKSSSSNNNSVLKENKGKRKVKFANPPLVYPFFGESCPPMPKLIALKILDNLTGKDIYAMSLVNTLWNQAAMDEALWE